MAKREKYYISKFNYNIDKERLISYEMFKEQKNRFVKELFRIDKNILFKHNFHELNQKDIKKHKNWYTGVIPKVWGVPKQYKQCGVHFAFYCSAPEKTTGIEYIRFPVGVEKPWKDHDKFKHNVIEALNRYKYKPVNCKIWPDIKFKLLEPTHFFLDKYSWEKAINLYLSLAEFNKIVADVIKLHHKKDCEDGQLVFPA
jgi:hypothetical protein